MSFSTVASVFLILFSVIDIPGSVPVLLSLRKQGVQINAWHATGVAALIMSLFLFFGSQVLGLFGIEISSFAIAGGFIIFLIGLELLLGITIFRDLAAPGSSGNVVPIAFPLVAGAGTLTTILTLKAEFDTVSIGVGILLNLVVVFVVLHSLDWLNRKVSEPVLDTLRKVFGIILLAIGVQIIKVNLLA